MFGVGAQGAGPNAGARGQPVPQPPSHGPRLHRRIFTSTIEEHVTGDDSVPPGEVAAPANPAASTGHCGHRTVEVPTAMITLAKPRTCRVHRLPRPRIPTPAPLVHPTNTHGRHLPFGLILASTMPGRRGRRPRSERGATHTAAGLPGVLPSETVAARDGGEPPGGPFSDFSHSIAGPGLPTCCSWCAARYRRGADPRIGIQLTEVSVRYRLAICTRQGVQAGGRGSAVVVWSSWA
jgi:hypothetical protein